MIISDLLTGYEEIINYIRYDVNLSFMQHLHRFGILSGTKVHMLDLLEICLTHSYIRLKKNPFLHKTQYILKFIAIRNKYIRVSKCDSSPATYVGL